MTSNTIPVYRNGRKFYVSAEQYERMRSEERQLRRKALLKLQQIPSPKSEQITLGTPSSNSYHHTQNTASSSNDSKHGTTQTRYLPVNLSKYMNNQHETIRLSRSRSRRGEERDDLLAMPTVNSTKKTSNDIRAQSSDKELDHQRTSSLPKTDDKFKRSSSAEILKTQSPSTHQQKTKQQVQISSHRPISTIVCEYRRSPTTSCSITPIDHTLLQINPLKSTSYLARMRQSNSNSPSKSTSLSNSATNSLVETSMQGFDRIYSVLTSPNRHSRIISSPIMNSSTNDFNKNEYSHHDTTSGSFSDDNSSSPSSMFQRWHINQNHNARSDNSEERENINSQQRESWTRSTIHSRLSDGITEKKRVRFADTEGFKLEITLDKSHLRSQKMHRLLAKRQNVKFSSDLQDKKKSVYDKFYQVTPKVGESKLATDV